MSGAAHPYRKWRRDRAKLLGELGIRVGLNKGVADMIRTEVVTGYRGHDHVRFARHPNLYPCERCRCNLVPLPSKCLGQWHYSLFCPMCDLAHVADAFAKMEAYVVDQLGPCPPRNPPRAKPRTKVAVSG